MWDLWWRGIPARRIIPFRRLTCIHIPDVVKLEDGKQVSGMWSLFSRAKKVMEALSSEVFSTGISQTDLMTMNVQRFDAVSHFIDLIVAFSSIPIAFYSRSAL
jgi:phenylalanine-4-hydroxylase